jgi:A/G-specific adenine glycosylase
LVLVVLFAPESFGLPAPGEPAMIACVVLGLRGSLLVAADRGSATIIGDAIGYGPFIGGRAVLPHRDRRPRRRPTREACPSRRHPTSDRRTPTAYDRAVEELLLAWYGTTKRDLPWRVTRDPYAILVSEVMLQQTQVERVVPRYRKWLERWPTAAALAAASAGDVIREWQGLGYNRRALALHRAASVVAADGWPDDLTRLPGVGPYTAAAIRNFAFGEDVLPRDVNVDRVERRTGYSFTGAAAQALMDLGATICLARIPRCGACPLASVCPSVGTRDEPGRKQGPFEGSFRQRRAETLRLVAATTVPRGDLDGDAVDALARDGLVVLAADGTVSLP